MGKTGILRFAQNDNLETPPSAQNTNRSFESVILSETRLRVEAKNLFFLSNGTTGGYFLPSLRDSHFLLFLKPTIEIVG